MISVVVAGCSGALFGTTLARPASEADELLVTVNGRQIRDRESHTVFASLAGRVVGDLALWRVVAHNFGGKGLKVENKEVRFPDYLRGEKDYVAFAGRLFVEQYLRKQILFAWPTPRLRKAYELFKDDLTQYDVSIMQIVSEGDLPAVAEDVHRDTDVESLAARYAVDETGTTRLVRKWYSGTDLELEFGLQLSTRLMSLKPRTFSRPMQVGPDYYLFYLNGVRNTFEQLRPALEQQIIESRSEALGYELLQKVQVTVSGSLGSDPSVIEYDPAGLKPPPGNAR